MATSQNGYLANTRSMIGSYALPGGKITARTGDVSVILLYVANRFHNEVEGLIWPGNWGYAERPIRGGTQLSNHASGTAIDLNAPRHPLGKSGTFNAAQRAKIREILNFLEGTVRWGGDYSGRKDEMHFEINKGLADVARIANKIRSAGGVTGGTAAPVPAAGSSSNPDIKWIQDRLNYWGFNAGAADGINGPKTKAAVIAFQRAKGLAADGIVGTKTRAALSANKSAPAPAGRPVLRRGSKGQAVKDLQNKLRVGYPAYAKNLKVDGDFGPTTERIVKEFQRRSGLSADGIVGPATYRKLGM